MKSINWTHHFIELIVVFIGLTLALLLDSWYESYKEQKLEAQYLSSFLDDIKQDQVALDSIIINSQNKQADLLKLQSKLINRVSSVDSILFYMNSLGSMSPFYPQKSTYESISNSGHLNLISNYNLKRKLVKLYLDYQQGVLLDNIYQKHLVDYIGPYLVKNIDFITRMNDLKVFYNKEFVNLISILNSLNAQNISYYSNLKTDTDTVITQLKNELNK